MTKQDVKNYLRETALQNVELLIKVADIDLRQVEICMRRQKKQTLQQIAIATKTPKPTVQKICYKCPNVINITVN